VEVLLDRLKGDEQPIVRRRAAEALERLGGGEALAGLVAALSDPIEEVRLAAARGVRSLDSSAATAEFMKLALEDPVWEIRVQAISALGSTGDPAVRPVLEECLDDPHESVSGAATNALRLLDESGA
jgi:HEAT repeat protein